jgi:hypothetical protein
LIVRDVIKGEPVLVSLLVLRETDAKPRDRRETPRGAPSCIVHRARDLVLLETDSNFAIALCARRLASMLRRR